MALVLDYMRKLYHLLSNYKNRKYNTYVLNKIDHPIHYDKCIQMKRYNNHVDNQAKQYTYCIFHHKNLVCTYIRLVSYNILMKFLMLFST